MKSGQSVPSTRDPSANYRGKDYTQQVGLELVPEYSHKQLQTFTHRTREFTSQLPKIRDASKSRETSVSPSSKHGANSLVKPGNKRSKPDRLGNLSPSRISHGGASAPHDLSKDQQKDLQARQVSLNAKKVNLKGLEKLHSKDPRKSKGLITTLAKIPLPTSSTNKEYVFANYEIFALTKIPKFLLTLEEFKQKGDQILTEKLKLIQSLQGSLGNLFEAFKTLQHSIVEPVLKRMSIQVEKLGVGDIRHHYLVICATYIARCNQFDLMLPITKELRKNSYRFLIDAGLILADFYDGQYYEQVFDFTMAQKCYFRMLLIALNTQDIAYELKAYDQLSKVYYYLQDIQKSQLLHRKFMEAETEPLDSRFRSEGIRNLLYTDDVANMQEFLIETYLREEELNLGKLPKLDQASRGFKAGLRRIAAEQDRKTRLYKLLTRQHRSDARESSQASQMKEKKQTQADPNHMYVTHLSYSRSISKLDGFKKIKAESKAPKPQFNFEVNAPHYWSFDEASFEYADTVEASNMLETERSGEFNLFSKYMSPNRTKRAASTDEYSESVAKKYGSSSQQQSSPSKKAQSSKGAQRLRSLYQPLITHTISKELTPKDAIVPADIQAIKPHLEHFAGALYESTKLVIELNTLHSYMAEVFPRQVWRNPEIPRLMPSLQELLAEKMEQERKNYTRRNSTDRETSTKSKPVGSSVLRPAHSVSKSLVAL